MGHLPGISTTKPTRAGYTFQGWYDNADFSGQPLESVQLVRGNIFKVAAEEFAAANKAGLAKLLEERKAAANKQAAPAEAVEAPPKEVVTGAIAGIEIMDLEDAVQVLWKNKIYAESGMGCTGPVVLVSDANLEKSIALLKEAGYVQ